MAVEREWRVRKGSRARQLWQRWGYVGWVLILAGALGLVLGRMS